MKQDRLRVIIDQFINEDRSSDPVVAVLCYDMNVAIALAMQAHEMLQSGAVPKDAYDVVVTDLQFKGGGKIVFSDTPGSVLAKIDSIIPDDRCMKILQRHGHAAEIMRNTLISTDQGLTQADEPNPARKPKRKPRGAAREPSEQL